MKKDPKCAEVPQVLGPRIDPRAVGSTRLPA
jgi:hypothetical protein